MTQTYEQVLVELAKNDERIVVMTAENRAAIRNVPALLPNRFIDTGITEQTLIGAAAGLALRGRIPVVHGLAAFISMRSFEFARTDVGLADLPVKIVGYVPGLLSDGNGPTHQALEDNALMKQIPGMQVFTPADNAELLAALPHIMSDGNPWYIRYYDGEATVQHEAFEPGIAEEFGDGTDVAILTSGYMLQHCYKAIEKLDAAGVSTRLVNLRTVKPLDEVAVCSALLECRNVLVVEDHFRRGGIYTDVCEIAMRRGVTQARVVPVSFHERWFRPAKLEQVLAHEGMDANSLFEFALSCHATSAQEKEEVFS